jgi:hypothetical protein
MVRFGQEALTMTNNRVRLIFLGRSGWQFLDENTTKKLPSTPASLSRVLPDLSINFSRRLGNWEHTSRYTVFTSNESSTDCHNNPAFLRRYPSQELNVSAQWQRRGTRQSADEVLEGKEQRTWAARYHS